MDDLFKKYKTVLLENENISIQLQKEKTKVMLLQEELNMLKCQDMPNTMKESISKNNAVIKTMDDNLENENLMLKQKVSEYENLVNENEKKFRDFYVKSKKYVMGLLGYEMNFTSDNIELLSLYAFLWCNNHTDKGDKDDKDASCLQTLPPNTTSF
ncbi:hypothetical protein BDAP_002284 [Binucleata daphniae]